MTKKIRFHWKCIIPLMHFLLSFFYERSILHFQLDKDIIASVAMNDTFSDTAERVMGYVIAKVFAALMIFFLWQLIFYVISHWKEKQNIRIFTIMTVVGLISVLCMWPDPFLASEDNLMTYSYAIRLWPEYWHSAYTSCVYTAMLMVVPHPVFISVFQWIFSVFAVGYFYNRVADSPVLRGKGKYLTFAVLLLPETYTLFTNPYRTELYALLCMFAVAQTAMDILDGRKRSPLQKFGIMVLCAFIGVWRTEGIILGILLYLIRLLFVDKHSLKKSLLLFAGFLLIWGVILVPQKLGDKKYYGKDYSFINSFPTLQNMLNASNANLSYEGVEEDLEAISKITPIELIQIGGMDGYRRYNYANGRGDINQSLADEATGKAYTGAYYRMVLHNLPIYARTQITMLAHAIRLVPDVYVEYPKEWVGENLPGWKLEIWDIGREDLQTVPGYAAWVGNPVHQWVSQTVRGIVASVDNMMSRIWFYTALLILIPLAEIFLFFKEFIAFCKKKKNVFGLAAIAFVLLGQAAAIVLVMPAGMLVYLHAYYYCSMILCIVYILNRMQTKGNLQEDVLR